MKHAIRITRPMILLGSLIFLVNAALVSKTDLKHSIKEKLESWTQRFPEERVYVQFDKTLYQPGETVWFTAYVRNADLTPDTVSDIIHIDLLAPNGTMQQRQYIVKNGTASGDFTFSNDMMGGIYKVKAYTNWQLNDSTLKMFEKEITLQKNVLPNLIMKLDFEEKGYSAGQTATAKLELRNLQGTALKQQAFTYTITLQGSKKEEKQLVTDDAGKAVISWPLPVDLQTADGLLNVRLEYNKNTESISRSIPINIKTAQLEFYPEGGDMVAGLTSKVAFSAIDEFGKPVNAEGTVFDNAGNKITDFQSFHGGMGSIELKPESGKGYYATLKNYPGKKFSLPVVKTTGTVMNISELANALKLNIQSVTKQNLWMVLQIRGTIYQQQSVVADAGISTINIATDKLPMGVARLTLFDEAGIPLTERMVFVNKNKQWNIQVTTNKDKYQPREKVKMKIKVREGNSAADKGDISVAVVDDKVISLANDKQGNILSKLLLEADIKGDVDEPNFYFDKNEPKADAALDLLMLTRGWRRFAWKQVLGEDTTAFLKPAEKAIISGVVRNFKTGKPAKRVWVTALGGNGSAVTDKEGRFSMYGVDLSQVQTLAVKKFDKELYYNVNHYGNDHDLNFEGGRSYYSGSGGYSRPNNGDNGTNVSWGGRDNIQESPAKKPEIKYKPGTGKITGVIIDENNEALLGATIVCNPAFHNIAGTTTDENGKFEIAALPKGKQQLTLSYIGYNSQKIDVEIKEGQDVEIKAFMNTKPMLLDIVVVSSSRYERRMSEETVSMDVIKSSNMSNIATIQRNVEVETQVIKPGNLNEVIVSSYRTPLIDPLGIHSSTVVTESKIQEMPVKNISDILSTVAGVVVLDGDKSVHIRGGRADATAYYIDGVKVIGDPNISLATIEQIRVYSGFIPARYGDVTGGVVEIETRHPEMVQYYSGSGIRITVLNENISPIYSVAREFPQIVHRPSKKEDKVFDDRKTIYWNGDVKLDEFGEADIEFYNGDELSDFRITAEGISDEGVVGHCEKAYSTGAAISIEAKFPSQAVSGDILYIPVVLNNSLNENVTADVNFSIPADWNVLEPLPNKIEIKANSSTSIPLHIKAGRNTGNVAFAIEAKADKRKEKLFRELLVKAAGYPQHFVHSDIANSKEFDVNINDIMDSTLKAGLVIYSSNIGSLTDGVKGMLAQPHGCFEQVSSSTYPNILALELLKRMNVSDKATESRAQGYIASGYTQLAKYETSEGGFDLWGNAPANIPMTAFGLMEFVEMQKVYGGVDAKMVDRTKKFLLARKVGGGTFDMGTKNCYFYGSNNTETANAYVAWALSEAGVKDIDDVAYHLMQSIPANGDAYQIALLGNTCNNLNRSNDLKTLNARLADMQEANGAWLGKKSSITGSTGNAFYVETTSLALLSLMGEYEKYAAQINLGIHYLLSMRGYGGTFGNTQSTVLALKALTACKGMDNLKEEKKFSLSVNGNIINTDTALNANVGSVTISGLEKYMNPGKNKVSVNFGDGGIFSSFSLAANWQTLMPVSNDKASVQLSTSLSQNEAAVGETVRMKVEAKNKTTLPLPSPMGIIEIPSGLSVQGWQLKELTDKKVIDHFETLDNSVILYFSELKPSETRTVNLDLKTEVKGEFTSAASVGYLYYTDELKQWNPGNKIVIR